VFAGLTLDRIASLFGLQARVASALRRKAEFSSTKDQPVGTTMSKHTNVNPDHYKVGGRERQGQDVVHNRERQSLERERPVTESWRQSQERRAARHASSGSEHIGISNRETAEQEAREREEHPQRGDVGSPPGGELSERNSDEPSTDRRNEQTSQKAGSRSLSQKEAETRHSTDPAPPSNKVAGAFGREPESLSDDEGSDER